MRTDARNADISCQRMKLVAWWLKMAEGDFTRHVIVTMNIAIFTIVIILIYIYMYRYIKIHDIYVNTSKFP